MTIRGIPFVFKLISRGEYKNLFIAVWFYLYQEFYEKLFNLNLRLGLRKVAPFTVKINVITRYPIAYKSPDHLVPVGTKNDNSTNKKFLLCMEKLLGESTRRNRKSIIDLGCSGGQLIKDFHDLGWIAVGLEGSDYSLKYQRANWPKLSGKNLFTCDITKPFKILVNGKKHRFQLITAWEVLEHIKTSDLPVLFKNIANHLDHGGYFLASTTSLPHINDGIDLHQTKMSNQEWRLWLRKHVQELMPVDLGLKFYQYVRFNFELSFLVYMKK